MPPLTTTPSPVPLATAYPRTPHPLSITPLRCSVAAKLSAKGAWAAASGRLSALEEARGALAALQLGGAPASPTVTAAPFNGGAPLHVAPSSASASAPRGVALVAGSPTAPTGAPSPPSPAASSSPSAASSGSPLLSSPHGALATASAVTAPHPTALSSAKSSMEEEPAWPALAHQQLYAELPQATPTAASGPAAGMLGSGYDEGEAKPAWDEGEEAEAAKPVGASHVSPPRELDGDDAFASLDSGASFDAPAPALSSPALASAPDAAAAAAVDDGFGSSDVAFGAPAAVGAPFVAAERVVEDDAFSFDGDTHEAAAGAAGTTGGGLDVSFGNSFGDAAFDMATNIGGASAAALPSGDGFGDFDLNFDAEPTTALASAAPGSTATDEWGFS